MEQAFPFERLTVIGLGLIGGSVAMAARERCEGIHIRGVDCNAETLQYALRHGIADDVSLTLPDTYEGRHLVILAAHLSANREMLKQLAPLVQGKPVLVSDIGSCKRSICELGRDLLPDQFIGGHPMAGKEFSGIEHATSLLFAGKTFLLTPHAQAIEARVQALSQFVERLGAKVNYIDPEQHDVTMAYVSHLPQLYSVMLSQLMARHNPGKLLPFSGAGLDDQLRLSASSYSMWGEIYRENADNIRLVLKQLGEVFSEADSAVDTDVLGDWFSMANRLHREFHRIRQTPGG
jgi:prephenate dehydrogenase